MQPPPPLAFQHVFAPAQADDAPTLLLLHGTGGNEHDTLNQAELRAATAWLRAHHTSHLRKGTIWSCLASTI